MATKQAVGKFADHTKYHLAPKGFWKKFHGLNQHLDQKSTRPQRQKHRTQHKIPTGNAMPAVIIHNCPS
ncbi:hypothetical protein BN14_03458 [Rhizoctonia solani AG-1 IB]|uniref:Uncharacterized protein n=1 Tax=Thanatephorus cucumeris (strain AG1-IB / isolate 7/3/14) TaxID=1108050 RepID=M5BSD9_THACB|nr:hypothetical protein BN14_03458 [Rhizoctonia solani AG-1 IB]